VSGRHRAARDWWPAILVSGGAAMGAGMWLVMYGLALGVACYSAGAWLAAAWVGHDITLRIVRRRDNQMAKTARPGEQRR
jgi:hypothetical protein